MENIESLIKKIRETQEFDAKKVVDRLYNAMLMMKLNLDPHNKFGGEFERMSKVISIGDVLYWWMVVVAGEKMDAGQILRVVSEKVNRELERGPKMEVMPPTVVNKDDTNQ